MKAPLSFWLRVPGTLWRTYRFRGLARRGRHEFRKRFGRFRPQPVASAFPGAFRAEMRYGPAGDWNQLPSGVRERILERSRRVLDGFYQAYGHEWRRLPVTAREWRTHPESGFEFPDVEWWRVPLMPRAADIKDVWEPGRFGWVYDLVRAHAVSPDPVLARAFYARLKDWAHENPPFRGVQWACGQEVAIRALAILHAMDGLPAEGRDDEAESLASTVLGWSGERIADAIGYGLSQRNNHGISEAAGLIHIGLRLQGAHPEAVRWLSAGRCLLEEQIHDQFAADGWYAQHSFNYTRVALEQAMHAERALRAAGVELSPESRRRLDAAVRLLVALVDETSGEVPNHGANDGARVTPLSSTPHRDFRPLLTLATIVRGTRLPADMPHDEETLQWLGTPESVGAAPRRGDGIVVGDSGWAIARVGNCVAFLRAGSYGHRPSHLDSLHLDVRIGGKEIVVDAGTFAYNSVEPWNNGLAEAHIHNGPLLEGELPAKRGPRFLWLSWPKARMVSASREGGGARIVAERPGFVRREVFVQTDGVRIDDLALSKGHGMEVTWLLHPDAAGSDCVRAEGAMRVAAREGDAVAWFSPTYSVRLPSCAVRITRQGDSSGARITTSVTGS